MSYLVLARKYRPSIFAEVIGQEHITDILTNAIQTEKVAHAYLFCGPRGTGKTSCARILAKSLNCEQGFTLTPCGQCASCQAIVKGTSFDVLEIDAASNRGIDEIRSLRENVKFAPSLGRYKIYIVDEVHMLTSEAFNALLKTLEEPPEHVIFILATTEVHKLPTTIISRCQRFDFKRLSVKTIISSLKEICQKEQFNFDKESLFAIAKAAEGSLRDALSILDQLSVISQKVIKAEDVFSMLGIVETEILLDLIEAIGSKDCAQGLLLLNNIFDRGKDLKQLTRDLTEHFRHLLIIKVGGKSLGRLVDYPVEIKEVLLQKSERFTLAEILNALDLLIKTQDVARVIESNRIPLEIAIAKLTYQGEQPSENHGSETFPPETLSKRPSHQDNPTREPGGRGLQSLPSQSPAQKADNQGLQDIVPQDSPVKKNDEIKLGPAAEDSSAKMSPEQETSLHSVILGEEMTIERIRRIWDTLTLAVSQKKMSVATYLQEGVPCAMENEQLIIGFPQAMAFQKESLEDKENKTLVEEVFSVKLKRPLRINYRLMDGLERSEQDTIVKKTLDVFKGKVTGRWHNE